MKWWIRGAIVAVLLLGLIAIVILYVVEPRYAYMPPEDKVMTAPSQYIGLIDDSQNAEHGYDLWGEFISYEEAQLLLQTEQGQKLLDPENGAIRVDDQLVKLGREMFYTETFGNECF